MMLISPKFGSKLAAGIFSLLLVSLASGQDPESAPPEKARALLDQVKRSELDRQIAVEQKEIDRLVEDQARTQRDSSGLQKTIDSTTALLSDSDEVLRNLNEESRRLDHEMKVAEARSSAERLKIEGLRALNSAQQKSLSALARRAEETEAHARVHTAELELLQAGKPVPVEGKEENAQTDLARARKALTAAEAKTVAEDRAARDAMKDAAAKMSLAETQAAKAQRLADNDLTAMPAPIAEKPKARSADKPEKKAAPDPMRQAQSVKPPAPVAAPPTAATAATTADPARKSPKPFVPLFKR